MAFFDRVRGLIGALDREGAIARALVLAHDRDLNLDLASALEVASTLASALNLDRDRVLDQARDLSGGLVRELAKALNSDFPLHRQHALNRAAATARDLARALDLALGSVLEADYLPDRTAVPDLDLSRALASALASYHALLRALASYPALDRERDLASDFARYRDLAQDLSRYLDHHSATPAGLADEDFRSLPRRVEVAVWLLPKSWQPRYREEFQAELARLSRDERKNYARRVLKEAWRLRGELKWSQCPPDRVRASG
jgi:hypothetical protein